jgi:hypothetical protein
MNGGKGTPDTCMDFAKKYKYQVWLRYISREYITWQFIPTWQVIRPDRLGPKQFYLYMYITLLGFFTQFQGFLHIFKAW